MSLLVVDIGNSDTVFGRWIAEETEPQIVRIDTTSILNQPDLISNAFDQYKIKLQTETINKVIVSSVVPQVTPLIQSELRKLIPVQIGLLEQSQFHRLPIHILKPDEIGTDLVANALAAYKAHEKDCIVVDFGTALSFTTIDKVGHIIGVSIAPGLRTALKALTAHTAQLQAVPLRMPPSALGKNTEQAIQTGILYGYDGLVKGIIDAQEHELNLKLFVIVTGGLSDRIPTLKNRVDRYAPYLTLEGLKLAAQYI